MGKENNTLEKTAVKSMSFLNFMVRTVFITTFIYTAFVSYFAWVKDSEQLMIVLTERWFTIMVGELVVMGFIQVVKEIFQSLIRKAEIEHQIKIENKEKEGVEDEY